MSCRFSSRLEDKLVGASTSRRALLKGACSAVAMAGLAGCGMFEDDPKKTVLPGRRIDVLSTGAGLTIDPHDTAPITLPAVQPVTEWTQEGRVASHESVNAAWNGTRELWSQSIGAGVNRVGWLSTVAFVPNRQGALQSPPVIGNGRMFTVDAQGVIRAWSWPGRDKLWRLQPARKTRSTNIGGGLALVGDTLYVVDGVAQALALDAATGRQKWAIDTVTPGRSAPTIVDGLMVFTTIDARLYAVDAATGQQRWTYQATNINTSLFGAGAPAIVNGIVVAGFGSGDLVALRAASGEVVWSDSLGGGNGLGAMLDFACVRGGPVVVGNTAYAISLSRVLVAIDMRSGRRLWEREVSGQSPLCVCGEWLFVISLDQQLACIDRVTGQVRWVKQLMRYKKPEHEKGPVQWSGPILLNNKLVCLSSMKRGGLLIVDAQTGKEEGKIETPSSCQVQPIVCDGQLLVLSEDGVLRAYG
ncbi:PQQ-like beta-propeller repeat protein [Bombella sp. TMW 2.2543]|uniref:PQQ-like beta-propeller repeat protein n=1 Tax=Bombella pluederhausensis TaxID=2967336 RepID=A0ABT3WIZ4_9PROT|nr:PQQ-binding-like beta-propeller repeat protein [Bombella pluederhausensis]MCX5617774.1 PQQ-like beta-propeller repeat protein [Bombella pluederhausensis]